MDAGDNQDQQRRMPRTLRQSTVSRSQMEDEEPLLHKIWAWIRFAWVATAVLGILILSPILVPMWCLWLQRHERRKDARRRPKIYPRSVICKRCDDEVLSEARKIKHGKLSSRSMVWTPSTRNKDGLSFLDLPREIRDQIYTLALGAGGNVHLGVVALERTAPHHWHPDLAIARTCAYDSNAVDANDRNVAVLAASKQLHFEGAQMLYSRNTFSVAIRWSAVLKNLKQGWLLRRKLRCLRLREVLPIAPRYQPFLYDVAFIPERTYGGNELNRFVMATLELMKDTPGSYIAFTRHHSSDVGVPTYCDRCEEIRSFTLTPPHYGHRLYPHAIVLPSDIKFFAGWSLARQPGWTADLAQPLPQLQIPREKLVAIIPSIAHRLQQRSVDFSNGLYRDHIRAAAVDEEATATLMAGDDWICNLGIRGEHMA